MPSYLLDVGTKILMYLPQNIALSFKQFIPCFKSCLVELVKLLNLQTLSKFSIVPNVVAHGLALCAICYNLDNH
jgi:hypothetical protein